MDSHEVIGFMPPAEGELIAVDAAGTAIAVTVLDGELVAFQDTCPHAGCSLAEGALEGSEVVCPCHFARFDVRSGALRAGPAKEGVSTWSARLTDDVLELEGPREPAAAAVQEAPSPGPGPARDITTLIRREHDAFRRQFTALEDLDSDQLGDAWTALAEQLEVHASGEEAVLYPHLVRSTEQGAKKTDEAVRDHNDIRKALRAVRQHEVGSPPWWAAVRAAQQENDHHLDEEEQDVLPALRDSAGAARLEELGGEWLSFHEQHDGARDLSDDDTDPRAVIEQ